MGRSQTWRNYYFICTLLFILVKLQIKVHEAHWELQEFQPKARISALNDAKDKANESKQHDNVRQLALTIEKRRLDDSDQKALITDEKPLLISFEKERTIFSIQK